MGQDSFAFPLSFAQQRLWFLDQLAPGNASYNLPSIFRLSFPVSVPLLERCLDEIARRHEALRTTFLVPDDSGGAPVQIVAPSISVPLAFDDLRAIPEAAQQAEAVRIATEAARRPFDLSTGPLLRCGLIRLGPFDHVFYVVMHHIVSDGWSLGIFGQELTALYTAFAKGRPSPLPELPIQYPDFAVWQRHHLQGARLEEQLQYWRGQLAGVRPLNLPTDRPRPAILTYRGTSLPFNIPQTLAAAARDAAQQRGLTLFMYLLAAFQAFLHRYSGQDEIVVGCPTAGRNRTEVEGLIGFFVNTVVIRTDLAGDPTFETLLRRVQQVSLGAYAHQDLPFETLVEKLQPRRELNTNPIFQVTFQLFSPVIGALPGQSQAPPAGRPNGQGSSQTAPGAPQIDRGASIFDLRLDLVEEPDGGLAGRLEYSTDLFDEITIRKMIAHLLRLLEDATANPARPVSQLAMASEAERRQVLVEWNPAASPHPPASLVHRLFEAQAASAPHAIAIQADAETFTYCQVDARADRWAACLARSGFKRGEAVALAFDRSSEMVVAMLAVLKAGGVYVPLDSASPADRLDFVLRDSGAVMVLAAGAWLERLRGGTGKAAPVRVLTVDELEKGEPESRARAAFETATGGGEAPAYIIYTSGSTGRPKGVCVPHRAIAGLAAAADYVAIGADDRVAHASSPSFDAATFEIWAALTNGARLVIMPRDILLDAAAAACWLRQNGITAMFLTTAVFNKIAFADATAFRPLRHLLFGGEAVDGQAVQAVLESGAPPARLLHVYGPTENTTFSTWHRVDEAADGRPVPIGRALAGRTAYILDTALNPIPAGVVGELCVGGNGVALRYLNNAELTDRRFVPDPFAPHPAGDGRMYRTGDLARWTSAGAIEFLGRVDRQVKIRGFRVEPAEIEATLAHYPGVEAAIVQPAKEPSGTQRLVAYIYAPQPDAEATALPKDRAGPRPARPVALAQTDKWKAVFNDYIYAESAADDDISDPTFNVAGWVSSYSGLPIPAGQMREWRDGAVGQILACRPGGPGRVLEIGCGTGLLLFKIAPLASAYVASDFSPAALDYVRRNLDSLGRRRDRVTLLERQADDFADFLPHSFDTIVMNSVIQYFPAADYLLRVVEEAVQLLASGGSLFIGDVRSLPLLETFHLAVELETAEADTPVSEVQQRASLRVARENELVVDPAFFLALKTHLPRIAAVEILPQRGTGHNELTQFRYQAVLHVAADGAGAGGGLGAPETPPPQTLQWKQPARTLAGLRRTLAGAEASFELQLLGIPNARLATAAAAAALIRHEPGGRTAGEVRDAVAGARGIEPEALWQLGAELGYETIIDWSGHAGDGRLNVLFRRPAGGAPWPGRRSSDPGAEVFEPRRLTNAPAGTATLQAFFMGLRSFARERLPDYMLPSNFVLLDELPLNASGKIDRAALPAFAVEPPSTRIHIAPRNTTERALCAIWQDVLQVDRVGIGDDFFADLGGHSLQATQIVSRIREILGLEIPLRRLFEMPTVAGLAEAMAAVTAEPIATDTGVLQAAIPAAAQEYGEI